MQQDALLPEPLNLTPILRAFWRERESAARIDDAVPWDRHMWRKMVESIADKAGLTGQARLFCYFAVGSHAPSRNLPHDVPDDFVV